MLSSLVYVLMHARRCISRSFAFNAKSPFATCHVQCAAPVVSVTLPPALGAVVRIVREVLQESVQTTREFPGLPSSLSSGSEIMADICKLLVMKDISTCAMLPRCWRALQPFDISSLALHSRVGSCTSAVKLQRAHWQQLLRVGGLAVCLLRRLTRGADEKSQRKLAVHIAAAAVGYSALDAMCGEGFDHFMLHTVVEHVERLQRRNADQKVCESMAAEHERRTCWRFLTAGGGT